ncbi:LIM/homeobox protein Lhx9-like [Lates calcarifer]|uniref:LIM/homeobox protein Lhx9 n=1 Tax=Lates calcarifer TaxID=8187 RepID=A0AAJ8DNB0_LATCA|nr:LIM/homeobox protein Lhx9-like [Lates calcarifer]
MWPLCRCSDPNTCCCCCLLIKTLNESVFSSLTRPVILERADNYPLCLLRTIMMSPDSQALEDLLYGSDLGDEAEGSELGAGGGGGPAGVEEGAAADNAPTAVSIQEPMICAGCGEQVCDRFFLLAAGRVWHGACLRCSHCQCELQTHPSLYWRDGNIYCQQDYCRMFGGGQCARCFQPIPASALVMRSGELTFHPHCFSCQECDIKLMPGNLYCMQGQNLYCQSHYHGDGSVPPSHDPQPKPHLTEGETQNQVSGEGEESVSSPEPRLDDRAAAGGRTRRRTKRIRTCFRSEQLRALESYFAQKHNPDGKDWTCLAHKTGLPKRVLQVWFQNARAKLRRSLSTDDSQVNSPSAPLRGVTVATASPPPARSPQDQPQPFSTSTIDHLQLSLLTAPLSNTPPSPAISQPQLQNPAFFLDYNSQSAPGISSLEAYEDFGEAGGGAEREADPDSSFRPHYC